jgi:hypothetical protein
VLVAVPASAQAEDINITNLNDDGAGSLQAALEAANLDPDSWQAESRLVQAEQARRGELRGMMGS